MKHALKKSLKWLALLLVIILIAICAAAWWFIRAPRANSSGVVTVPALKQDLSITRNAQGVPHIQAANINDAYFGLGFVHAQDRLWQLMFHRRVAQGRLSEVLGESTLDTDKFIRTLGVMQRAKAAVKELQASDPVALSRMQAYADGINLTGITDNVTAANTIGGKVLPKDCMDTASCAASGAGRA